MAGWTVEVEIVPLSPTVLVLGLNMAIPKNNLNGGNCSGVHDHLVSFIKMRRIWQSKPNYLEKLRTA